ATNDACAIRPIHRGALLLGSTGCQPVVAGSPAGNTLVRIVSNRAGVTRLGKLPRLTGWQPVLPRSQRSAGYSKPIAVAAKSWPAAIRPRHSNRRAQFLRLDRCDARRVTR